MAAPYELTQDARKKIGLVVLQADETIEGDMRRMLPADVDLLVSRVPSGTEVSTDSLQQMSAVLTDAVRLFPAGATFNVIGYGCTSGTAQIGPSEIATLIRKGANATHISEPVTALIAACKALGVRRIGLLSPYVPEVSDTLCAVLQAAGITVTAMTSFDEPQESNVIRIAPQSIKDAATALQTTTPCDAVFLSCTNLRTLDVIDDLETALGVPVLSSNQVLAWHMLQVIGASFVTSAPGRLWR